MVLKNLLFSQPMLEKYTSLKLRENMKEEDKRFRKSKTSKGERQKNSQGDNEKFQEKS